MKTSNDNLGLAVLCALATALLASLAAAAAKVAGQSINVFMVVFVQSAICFTASYIFYRFSVPNKASERRVKLHLIRGLSGCAGFYGLYGALQSLPLVEVTLLRNTAPLLVPVVVWLGLRIIVPASRWLPILIGFVGVALILAPQMSQGSFGISGYLLGLLSGVMLAVSMVSTRLLSSNQTEASILLSYFGLSLLVSTPLAILNWQAIPAVVWLYLLFMGSAMFLTMWFYTVAYKYAKPSVVSPISYFAVVFSGLLGWSIWGHIPSLLAFVGIALVVGSGIATVYLSNKH